VRIYVKKEEKTKTVRAGHGKKGVHLGLNW